VQQPALIKRKKEITFAKSLEDFIYEHNQDLDGVCELTSEQSGVGARLLYLVENSFRSGKEGIDTRVKT